jgi:para-aminobenzoate synthetase component 1
MTSCRFENRLTGQARVLSGFRTRITASRPEELTRAFERIEAERANGAWIALLLDYELGEWLEPSLAVSARHDIPGQRPRLTALVFEAMHLESPWNASHTDHACITTITPEITKSQYIERIEKIHQWIEQGDVYQVNATFALQVSTVGEPEALYRKIADQHPVSFAAYIEDQSQTVLSFSPELFLQRCGQTLTTRPMKGTAPRSSDPDTDRQIGLELQNSEKNRAENLMIVDLLRNDLGRVANPGTVRAEPLFSLEKYPSVWTMTSTVQAKIPTNTSLQNILTALFPCGSVTGAPKIKAMQRIQQTESSARGLYCGSIGWLAPDGDFCLNVAIRTLILDENGHGQYHVGGGIVHDSDAEDEWQECFWKARILTQAQPSLIETMHADNRGNIALLALHLDRLESSAKALNFQLPEHKYIVEALSTKISTSLSQINEQSDLRIRLLLNAAGTLNIETAPLPVLQGIPKVAIAPELLDSQHPLLQHKTTFRPWYAQTTKWLTTHPDYFDLIYFNEQGELCEGSRSNIYIKKNGQWITPVLSSGLLGGVYRTHLMNTQQIKEGTLTRADLIHPTAEIRLSNGLRGWFDVKFEPTSLLPGNLLP